MTPPSDSMTGPGNSAGGPILVTGASGYLGSRLVERLLKEGRRVHAVSRRERQDSDGLRWWRVDLADPVGVGELFARVRPELVYHLAGEAVGKREREWVLPLLRGHVLGTAHLLSAALDAGVRRVVMTGSLEEPEPSERWVRPSLPYAAAKWASSAYARMFHALYGAPVVLLRVFMVYGPGRQDVNKLIPYVVRSLLRGERPKLSSGRREIDWIYIDDVVEAFLAAARAGEEAEGSTLDVGSGRLISIRELVERLVGIVSPGLGAEFGLLADRPMEQVRSADLERTERMLAWRPRTDLEGGLRETVDWYRMAPARVGP